MEDELQELYRIIGLKVAYYRRLNHWNQEDLANAMHVSKSYVGKIEAAGVNKRLNFEMLLRVSKALDVPVYKLLEP